MDDISLVNAALVKAGCSPITTFTEDSAEADVARANFDRLRRYVLSLHPWRFATRLVPLSRATLETPPISVFDATYILPDCARINGVRVDSCPIYFDRYENLILCDALETDAVIAELVMLPAVDFWPDYASAVLVEELIQVFALGIAEDSEKAAVAARKAQLCLTNAKTADSQGRTNAKMPVGRFRSFVAGGQR